MGRGDTSTVGGDAVGVKKRNGDVGRIFVVGSDVFGGPAIGADSVGGGLIGVTRSSWRGRGDASVMMLLVRGRWWRVDVEVMTLLR